MMTEYLKDSLEGLGIGIIAGLVIGLTDNDWIRMTLAIALITYAGRALGNYTQNLPGPSYRIAFMGIFASIAVLAGLYIQGQHLFRETPLKSIEKWVKAGYTPIQARQLYLESLQPDAHQRETAANTFQKSVPIQPDSTGLANISILKDSLLGQIDTLKSLLSHILAGEKPESSLVSTVASNLFSSRSSEPLCETLDPGLNEDTLSYISSFQTSGFTELESIQILHPSKGSEELYELATLFWRLICTLESDARTPWAELTDPARYGDDAVKLHEAYQGQERKVFGLLSAWLSKHASNQLEGFRAIHALISKKSGIPANG
ncbi:MAG: hypothetical protein IPH45_07700 [Bacteroidales bacterium]|nr:hypothetical protein [Bacteroidales bacterium]